MTLSISEPGTNRQWLWGTILTATLEKQTSQHSHRNYEVGTVCHLTARSLGSVVLG